MSVINEEFDVEKPEIRQRLDIAMALALINKLYDSGKIEYSVFERCRKNARKRVEEISEK